MLASCGNDRLAEVTGEATRSNRDAASRGEMRGQRRPPPGRMRDFREIQDSKLHQTLLADKLSALANFLLEFRDRRFRRYFFNKSDICPVKKLFVDQTSQKHANLKS